MTDPARVPLPSSPLPSPARSPFSPLFSPTTNHPISPLTYFTPLPGSTPHHSQPSHSSSGTPRGSENHSHSHSYTHTGPQSRQHTGGSNTPYYGRRPSLAPSESVSTAPSRRSSSRSYGHGHGHDATGQGATGHAYSHGTAQGGMGASYLRSMSPAGQGPFRPRLDRNATIRRDMGASVVQQPQDPFYEGVTIEVNQPVGSLSISPSNRDVCLASRKGLYIIDLANLHNAPRFVPQGGTWQIADCQWSPHPASSNLILSTSSQKLLVWDLAAQVALRLSIDAHARAITDINWHARDPNLMATASMDAGIRGWDLRCPDRPYMRVCAWGEAVTQIKWNRQHDHLFATAHGKEVLVWDNRKGSVPVVDFKAHDAKIYGIDWDREHRHKLVTCSLDQTVKYWTVSDLRTFGDSATHTFYPQLAAPAQASSVVKTGYPVWRARNLPFGHGVIALPQRGNQDLEMFALGNDKPVHTFEGHTDVVKDFVWRSRGGNDPAFENREFQLVTWSKDQTLRIWPVSREVTESVGYQYGAPIRVLVSRRGAKDITYTTTHRADDKQVVPLPIVNQPSGIAKARAAAHPGHGHGHERHHRDGGMTRGGGKTKVVDQLEWLTKVIKNKASPDISAWPSRMGSVSARGSRSGSRDRLRGVSQGPGFERTGTMGTSATGGEAMSLKDEIVIVNQLFPRPKVRFEKIDLHHKKLTMSMSGPWANGDRMAFCRIHWSFPAEYPNGIEIPTFELERNPTVSPITRQKLVMTLKEIRAADKQCLVQTCAFLLGQHEASRSGRGRRVDEESDSESESGSATGLAHHGGGKIGANVVMLIRNCGATFGPSGQLVCFFPKRTVLPRIRGLSQHPIAMNAYGGQGVNGSRDAPALAKAMSALSSLARPDASHSRSHHKSQLALRRARMGITAGIGAALGFTDNSQSTVQAGSTVTIHSLDVPHRHAASMPVGSGDGFNRVLAKEYGVPSHLRDLEHMIRIAEKHKRIDHLHVLHALWGAIGDYSVDEDAPEGSGRETPPPPYSGYAHAYEPCGSRDRWEHSLARRKVMVDRVFQTLLDNRDIQMLALVSILVLLHVRTDPPPPHLLDPREQVMTVSPVQDYFAIPLPRNVSHVSQPTPNPRSRNSIYANSQGYPSPLLQGGPTSAPGYGHTAGHTDRHQRGSSAPHGVQQPRSGQSGTWTVHPSSHSLRALGAMTPRDRGSIDALARTPFGMSFDVPSPNLGGTGMSTLPQSIWANSLLAKGKSPRAANFGHKEAPAPQHRDSDLGVKVQERPRHPVMGRRQRMNSRAATLVKDGDESGAETPKAQPRSAEGTGDVTPTVRPGSGSAFAGSAYGLSGMYGPAGSAPLRSAGTDRSYTSGTNGSYGRSGYHVSGGALEQEVGSAGSVKWYGSPVKRKLDGPSKSQIDLRTQGKGEKEGVKKAVPAKICGVRIEIIQPGQDRFDNDPRHAPLDDAQLAPAMQSIWKNVYADLLLRSELFMLRAELMQYDFVQRSLPDWGSLAVRDVSGTESGIACVTCVEVGQECCGCGSRINNKAIKCSYCRLTIKGLFTTCTLCSHRTHLSCFRIHTGINAKSHSGAASQAVNATCASCPCRCLYDGGLTGAVLAYGPPPDPVPHAAILPYDDTGMISSLYQDASTSPEIAAGIAMPGQAQVPAQTWGETPRPRNAPGVEQFPFPPQAQRRGADRERDRSIGPGFSGLGSRGKGIGNGRRGGEGSPRRSISATGRGDLRSASASGIGTGGASSSGFSRLARGTTASAAAIAPPGPPTAASSSSHARGLSNIGAIGGGTGLGLGLGLGSVAEQAHEGPSALTTPTTAVPPALVAGEGSGNVPAPTPAAAAGSKGWYGYANPYANFTARAPQQAPGLGAQDTAAIGGGVAALTGQQAQGQAQGAQGLLARARAAMDAGAAWR